MNSDPLIVDRGGGWLEVREAKKERTKAYVGDSINIAFPNSKFRRGRVGHGVAQTILTQNEQVVVVDE